MDRNVDRILVALDVATSLRGLRARRSAPRRRRRLQDRQSVVHRGRTRNRPTHRRAGRSRVPRSQVPRHSRTPSPAPSAAAAELGVWMLNVHASGGRRMLEAARRAVDDAAARRADRVRSSSRSPSSRASTRPRSTTSASIARRSIRSCGSRSSRRQPGSTASSRHRRKPRRFARRAGRNSSSSLPESAAGAPQAAADDQQRTLTPAGAVRAGASYLVVGRPITAASDPRVAAERIAAELG